MKQRLLFLGPPGVGKGTQAELISKTHNLLHLSTGDLLRQEVKAGSQLGKQAEVLMNSGELVSDELVLSIVENKLNTQSQGWLLDGFPRNVNQAKALEDLLKKIHQPIELVVLLELRNELLIERLISRGRADDTEAVVRHRLEVYREKTAPLIDFYSNKGLLKSVNGDGSIVDIQNRIMEILS